MSAPSRRQFLSGLAASAILAPFAASWPSVARASSNYPKRLVIFFSPNGTIHQQWRPQGSGASFSFPSGSILEPLAAIQDRVIVCDGINFVNATNHEGGMAAMLTGGGSGGVTGGMSLDQYLASSWAGPTPFASLELGVHTSAWGGSTQTRMAYSGTGSFVTPDDQPTSVFSRLFGDVGADAQAVDTLRRRRLSLLDVLRDDVRAIERRVGHVEKLKLDAHLEAFRRMELSLADVDVEGCSPPTQAMPNQASSNESFPLVGEAQQSLLVSALACDLTRVASIQWSHTVSPTVFSWLGHTEAHHGLSHCDDGNTQGVAQFVEAERWFAERFVELVQSLDARPDPLGEGSLLDNTVVLWAKEMGDGRLHDCNSVPFVIAGGADSPFELGRYLDFGGAPHNHLLTSLCQGLGLSNTSFGDASVAAGTLSELI